MLSTTRQGFVKYFQLGKPYRFKECVNIKHRRIRHHSSKIRNKYIFIDILGRRWENPIHNICQRYLHPLLNPEPVIDSAEYKLGNRP
jgi:hypothetical protein